MPFSDHVPERLKRLGNTLYPLKRAMNLWNEAGGMRMSAAMSFYGILSLAPLLLAIVGLLGWWMDRSALEDGLIRQLGSVIGPRGTAVISDALKSAKEPSQGIAASVAGFLVLLFGATGVFNELQSAFEQVWSHGRGVPPKQNWWHAASLRLRGVGYILVFGFLLLISLVVSTLLTLVSGVAGDQLWLQVVFRVINEIVSFVVCAALFAGLMRLSGGDKPRLRYMVFGGCVGAIMFTIGRQLMTFYLASAAVVSAYGAAGSLIVLLMWIYFSSAVLLLGAGCARALEEHVANQKAGRAPAPPPGERRKGERRLKVPH